MWGGESSICCRRPGGVSPSKTAELAPTLEAIPSILECWSRARAFVGYATMAKTARRPSASICIMGMRKASVLPEAVGATITVSSPRTMLYRASCWNLYSLRMPDPSRYAASLASRPASHMASPGGGPGESEARYQQT